MALWPVRVYTRTKQPGRRLNLTPALEPGPPSRTEAPQGPKGKGKERGLPKIAERAERGWSSHSGSELPSIQLRDAGEKSLQEENTGEETHDEIAPLSESVIDDLQLDSNSSNSELISGPSFQHDISSSFSSYSITESYTEYKNVEENLSSFSSPELFRGSNYLDWDSPKLTEYVQCKNSTLLDNSKAVAIEKMSQFSNLSAILGTSSENCQKHHKKIGMTLANQNISPQPKCTSNSESDDAACEVLLAEKICPSTPEETKKKPPKDSEDRKINVQTQLNCHGKIDALSSHNRPTFENNARRPPTQVLLPRPLAPALKTNLHTPNKKSRCLLTSTPSSEAADFVIDLSSIQKESLEELFPNVSNDVNSDEIVPVSGLQEYSSNEFPSGRPEICCIIKASPGSRQMKSSNIGKKKKHCPPEDIPEDVIIKTHDRM